MIDKFIPDQFINKVEQKGWTKQELAKRWGVGERQISNINKSPKIKDFDALRGLPDYEFNLNEYKPILLFCLWGNWTLKNYELSFNVFLKQKINSASESKDTEIEYFDVSLAFHVLDVICYEMITHHSRSLEMFELYKTKIEVSAHSRDSRLLALAHFISDHFFGAFPDYYLLLSEEKKEFNDGKL